MDTHIPQPEDRSDESFGLHCKYSTVVTSLSNRRMRSAVAVGGLNLDGIQQAGLGRCR